MGPHHQIKVGKTKAMARIYSVAGEKGGPEGTGRAMSGHEPGLGGSIAGPGLCCPRVVGV